MRAICLGLVSMAALQLCASAEADRTSVPDLIVSVDRGDPRDFELLKSVVEAQLSDCGLRIRLQKDSVDKRVSSDLATRAKTLLRQSDAVIVAVFHEQTLAMMYADNTSTDYVERQIFANDNFEDVSEATASMIRSTVAQWLSSGGGDDAVMAASEDAATSQENLESNVVGFKTRARVSTKERGLAISHRRDETEKGIWFGLASEAAYRLQVIRTVDPVLNGVYGGLRLGITRFSALAVGGEFLQRSSWQMVNWAFKFRRIPLRLRLLAHWPMGRLSLGIFLGIVADFTRIEGHVLPMDDWMKLDREFPRPEPPPGEAPPKPTFADEGARVFFGVSSGITAEVSVFRWFSLFLNGGADVIVNPHRFILANDFSVYSYQRAQIQIQAGCRFRIYQK